MDIFIISASFIILFLIIKWCFKRVNTDCPDCGIFFACNKCSKEMDDIDKSLK